MIFNLIDEDPILGQLTPYTVGWLREIRDGGCRRQLVPSGSGVLVEIGGIRGVMTAAHVVLKLKKRGPDTIAALFTVVRQNGKARPLVFPIGRCDCVTIGGEHEDPLGPDLAFVRLPHEIEARLVDENLFYNYDKRLQAEMEGAPDCSPLEKVVIVGVVGEKSEEKLVNKERRIDTHVMVHAYGGVGNFLVGNAGLDIFDLAVIHNESVTKPQSYGGLSGAGVWVVGDEPGTTKRSLFGIAFHQTRKDEDGDRVIVCHGPRCIYRQLVDKIAARFTEFRTPACPKKTVSIQFD